MQWGQRVLKVITFSTHWETLPLYSHVNNAKHYPYLLIFQSILLHPSSCTTVRIFRADLSPNQSVVTMYNMSSQHIPSNHVGWMGNNPIGFVNINICEPITHPFLTSALTSSWMVICIYKTRSNGLHWCHCSHRDYPLQTTKARSTITSLVYSWEWPWID